MPQFTPANAREMAAKAHAARLERLASGKQAGETFPQTPQVGPHEAANDYVCRRLARVRAQLDLVDKQIKELAQAKTIDGQELNWLCAAQERLAEQERVLAGRPLPGSRKPAPEKPRRPTWGTESVLAGAQPTPTPAQPQPPACAVEPVPG